ncbi:hypothetical protein IJJ05_01770 [Candidatus Saccharibacteria bacterium]|nr:hypothetical protein [Candidatus Saccharibacteria bacterium]
MIAKRRRKSRKWIARLIFLILIVVAGAVCYFVWDSYFRDKTSGEDETRTAEIIEEPEKGDGEDLEATEIPEVVEEKKVILYEGDDPNEKSELTGVITYAGVSGNFLMVRVNIDQYLSEGNCRLDLMRGGSSVYSDSATIVSSAATATCEGFNIPISALGAGDYGIVITLSSDGKEGVINGEVSI